MTIDETTDFSKLPPSLEERRAEQTEAAIEVSPRTVLIQLLREIDSGERKPHSLILMVMEEFAPATPTTCVSWDTFIRFAGRADYLQFVGLLERGKTALKESSK